jgi:hypothetical protein
MPYEVKKDGEDYLVINKDTGEEKARHSPPDAEAKAHDQLKLLEGIEHGMTPRDGGEHDYE